MADAPRLNPAQLPQAFLDLPVGRKIGLMMALAATIAVVAGLWIWAKTPDWRVLYAGVAEKDGGAVLAALQAANVPYKVAEGGSAILVPADQVYDLRLKLASQGLPRGGTVGFEIMEGQKLGASQFLEQVNYQRALEGELARSIQSLSAVQGARVHLAIPKPSVFVRENSKPSASVILQVAGGRALDPSQVAGIVHLVASSVPELAPGDVTVVDQNGKLLSSKPSAAGRAGLDASQLDYVRRVEDDYANRIQHILEPLLGMDNVRAQVTADMDFTETEQTAESFKPNASPQDSAIRSQQTVQSTNGGGAGGAAGIPGALSNQPPGTASAPLAARGQPGQGENAAAAAAAGASSHRESTTNFEVDKTIRHTKQAPGIIKRLSVAVAVNFRKTTDAKGKVTAKPLAQQEMTQIQNLVKEAMGFSTQRGDSLNVVNASFTDETRVVEETPAWKDPANVALVKDVLKYLLIAGVLLFLVFGVIRPAVRDLAKVAAIRAAQPPPAPAAAGNVVDVVQIGGGRGGEFESGIQSVKDVAKQDPRVVATVVKDWISRE